MLITIMANATMKVLLLHGHIVRDETHGLRGLVGIRPRDDLHLVNTTHIAIGLGMMALAVQLMGVVVVVFRKRQNARSLEQQECDVEYDAELIL
jgi:hypothetical protein